MSRTGGPETTFACELAIAARAAPTRLGCSHNEWVLLQGFEAILAAVLAHVFGVPDLAIHGDVDSRRQALHGANRAANVEDGVGIAEARGVERTGQHDGLAFQA